MSSLKYFAKREHVPKDFSKLASDVSVSSSDNSFNTAGVVSFSGLSSGDWIKVVGYNDPQVDGWHQLSINSTVTKITTLSILPDIASGASIRIDGFLHGDGQEYGLDLLLSSLDPVRTVKKKTHTAKSGRQQTRVYRDELYYSGQTQPILRGDTPEVSLLHQYREAFASLLHGETAIFDPDEAATIASPVNPISVKLDQVDLPETRLSTSKYFTIGFKFKYYPF